MSPAGILVLVGLALVFVGQRVLVDTTWSYAGAALIAVAAAWLGALTFGKSGHRSRLPIFAAAVTIVVGVGVQFAELEDGLSYLWMPVVVIGLCVLLFTERALREAEPILAKNEDPSPSHMQRAVSSGLSLGLALTFVGAINVAARERDHREDLSYFARTEPDESTVRMLSQLERPLKAMLFFDEGNEVYARLQGYFGELEEVLPMERVDYALQPEMARKMEITGNGQLAIVEGEGETARVERISIGTELQTARSALRTLDARIRQAIGKLAQVRREVHRTVGHNERPWSANESEEDPPERVLGLFSNVLRQSNLDLRELGPVQGLAQDVPAGVPLVVVAGPREPMNAAEADSLLRYFRRGGRLLLLLDHSPEDGLEPLLNGLGVKRLPGRAASEATFVPNTRTKADHGHIYTNVFSDHRSVQRARANARLIGVEFEDAAGLTNAEGAETQVVFPMRSKNDVWRDLDNDWERDEETEPLESLTLMAAISAPAEEREARAIVIAEADFASDGWLRRIGNQLVLGDTLEWLLSDIGDAPPPVVAPVETEEDRPIEHTREEDQMWFYGTSFGVPIPILALGLFIAARQRRGPRSKKKQPTASKEASS